MSHDTHDTHGHHHHSDNDKPVIAFKAAFFFVLILAGLFVAALGFVKSMGHEDAGHGTHGAQHTEAGHVEHGAPGTHEAVHTEGNNHAEHSAPASSEGHNETAPAEHH